MSIRAFSETIETLSNAYNKRFFLDEDVLNTWFKYFSEFTDDVFSECVDKWIRENKMPPSISELLDKCNTARERRKNEEKRRKEEEYRKAHWTDAGEEILERTDEFYDPYDDEARARHNPYDGWRIDDDGRWIRLRI